MISKIDDGFVLKALQIYWLKSKSKFKIPNATLQKWIWTFNSILVIPLLFSFFFLRNHLNIFIEISVCTVSYIYSTFKKKKKQ